MNKDGTQSSVSFDSFKPKVFFNDNAMTIKNTIHLQVSFEPEDRRNLYIVKKLHSPQQPELQAEQSASQKQKQALTQDGIKLDQTLATASNFMQATLGQTLEYGNKSLTFQGIFSASETDDWEPSCLFEYKNLNQNFTQKFHMNPRYYLSSESEGEGDGLYEFRPLNQTSFLYSEVKSVEMKKGDHSGQFLITYDQQQSKDPKEKIQPRVIVVVELQE
mmetsp:Transcript_4442/g.6558  ORF Transcript_4442/g.6558 Transcript_4442/m.6558 type:complete len:218 (-) Transcript_4442:1128-1781(-)